MRSLRKRGDLVLPTWFRFGPLRRRKSVAAERHIGSFLLFLLCLLLRDSALGYCHQLTSPGSHRKRAGTSLLALEADSLALRIRRGRLATPYRGAWRGLEPRRSQQRIGFACCCFFNTSCEQRKWLMALCILCACFYISLVPPFTAATFANRFPDTLLLIEDCTMALRASWTPYDSAGLRTISLLKNSCLPSQNI